MKILFATVSLALLACTVAVAQNNDMNKEVEVTKEYMPDVNRATKLFIAPKMIDTVTLRPEIDYAIRPTPWLGSFGVAAIKPITVHSAEFSPLSPFYLKAGIGFPLNSVLDFYGTGGDGKNSYYGVALNHSGDYYKVTNNIDERLNATKSTNRIGVFGAYNNSKRFWVGGEIGYNYDLYTPYGGYKFVDGTSEMRIAALDMERKKYSTPTINLWLGNDFRDMSKFNIRGYADGYYFTAGNKVGETGIAAGVELGQTFSKVHTVMLKAGIENFAGMDSVKNYSNMITTISPSYTLTLPKFRLKLGVDVAVDNQKAQDTKVWMYPNIELTLNLINEYIVPFATANGKLANNGVRNTVLQNPYSMSGLTRKNTSEYNFRAGIGGTLAPQFAYRLYVGVSTIRDYSPFMNYNTFNETNPLNSNVSAYTIPKVNVVTVGAEANGQIGAKFSYWIAAHYYGNTAKDMESVVPATTVHPESIDLNVCTWMPNYDANIGLTYNHQDKFRVKVGATLLGERKGLNVLDVSSVGNNETLRDFYQFYTIDPVFDINAAVELQISRRTAVFLEAHNIGGSKLYYYPHQPSVGLTCTAGVKICF